MLENNIKFYFESLFNSLFLTSFEINEYMDSKKKKEFMKGVLSLFFLFFSLVVIIIEIEYSSNAWKSTQTFKCFF